MARTAQKKVSILDEGVLLVDDVDSINFTGPGHSGSAIDNDVTEDFSGGSGGGGYTYAEVPAGALDGVNTVFVLAHTPTAPAVMNVVLNGASQWQDLAGDYTVSGATITFNSPPDGRTLVVY